MFRAVVCGVFTACLLTACGGSGQDDGNNSSTNSIGSALVAIDDALANGDFAQALEQLEGIYHNPQLTDAQASDVLVDQSVALTQLGRQDEASAALDTALKRDVTNAVAYLNRGALRLTKGDALAAREDFDKAIELDPQDPAAYRNRSLAWVALGELDAAYVDLSAAMQHSEFDAELFLERAAIWDAKDNNEYAALNELIYATSNNLAEHGEDPAVLLERALTWFALGEGTQAEADLTRVLKLEPGNVQAQLVMAQLFWELDKPVQAITQYNTALANEQASAEERASALLGRANSHQLGNNCGAARSDYEQILQGQTAHLAATTGLGWVLVNCADENQRNPTQALALAQRYLGVSKAQPWVLAELMAAAHVALGDSAQAQRLLQQALSAASLPNPSPQREQLLRAQREYAAEA